MQIHLSTPTTLLSGLMCAGIVHPMKEPMIKDAISQAEHLLSAPSLPSISHSPQGSIFQNSRQL